MKNTIKKYTKFISIITIINCASASLIAQIDTLTESNQVEVNNKLKNDELEVIKDFKAKLANASPIDIAPTIEAAPKVDRKYDYRVTIVPYAIDYPKPEIKPFAMQTDEPQTIYKGYSKLGFGNFKSPLASISFHDQKEGFKYGILANYLALDNSNKNAYQKMSDIDVSLTADLKVNDQLNISTALMTSIDQRYLFHINANKATEYSEGQAKRNINIYGAKIGLFNSSDYALQYKADVTAKTLSITNDDSQELDITVDGGISYSGRAFGIGMDMLLNFSDITDIADTSFQTLSADPYVYWASDRISIKGGINITSANDSIYLFPTAEILADIIENKFQITLGVDQEHIHNSQMHTLDFNPYYQFEGNDYGTTIRRSYYGGLQGEWSKLVYRSKVGYREISNQVMLLNAEDIRKFSLSYIDLNSIFIEATASYSLTDILNIGGGFQQNIFDIDDEQKAYHIPSMRYQAFAELYLLDSKLSLRPSIAFTDKVDYIDENGNNNKLDAMLSVNLQSRCKITDNFGLFVDAKNLLSNNYSEYYGYEDVGLHIHGGLLLKF